MTIPVTHTDVPPEAPVGERGMGALRTERGNLPLRAVDVSAAITGTVSAVGLAQTFRNPFDTTLEATYVFPLPERAAVTALRMTAAGRTVEAALAERERARRAYDDALASGHRGAIAEEDRPDVFTLRVGNIEPGEEVRVELRLTQPLTMEEGEATFRFPFVVAPRYIPGSPLDGPSSGDGTANDTDAVPDASRISPPVLLPGFPNPIELAMTVTVDPGELPVRSLRSSLHVITSQHEGSGAEAPEGGDGSGVTTLRLRAGERLDRDFVLRFELAEAGAVATAAHLTPDGGDSPGRRPDPAETAGDPAGDTDLGTGTFNCVVAPPSDAAVPRPRDLVLLLDRSGSMRGWKMVAARRAAARIVDTLTDADRFAVLCFDYQVEVPEGQGDGLVPGTDRNRFRAVTHLAATRARGGTELLGPVRRAVELLGADAPERDRVLVLVTDGQVGNEDQILAELGRAAVGVRTHAVGIDQAVNAGFLNRLASLGQGRCELVESEDRLDAAMDRVHRRIGSPVLTGVELTAEGLEIIPDTVLPPGGASVFPGVPLTILGRWRGPVAPGARLLLRARTGGGEPWESTVTPRLTPATGETPAAAALWARARLRALEDRYAATPRGPAQDLAELERAIVETSLRFGVLCRFTAFVAVDSRAHADGPPAHRVIQPVEMPRGWAPAAPTGLPESAPGVSPLAAHSTSGRYERAPRPAPHTPTPPFPPPPITGAERETVDWMSVESERGGVAGSAPPPGESPVRAAHRPGFRMARPAQGRVPAHEAEATVRAELGEEARRLRAASDALADQPRREYLADLGSRLAVQLTRLREAGVAERELRALIDLVAKLRECEEPLGARGGELAALWEEAARVLEREARGPARPPFWKR